MTVEEDQRLVLFCTFSDHLRCVRDVFLSLRVCYFIQFMGVELEFL
jgi:hypothetical protein